MQFVHFFIRLIFVLAMLLPTTLMAKPKRSTHNMSIKEAVLLTVRKNPEIQSAELQRIIDKYNVRVAQDEFELQYTLNGSLSASRTKTAGALATSHSASLTPTVGLLSHYGTQFTLTSSNDTTDDVYNPSLSLKIVQPLIRGFGKDVVMASLRDAYESEEVAKLSYKQKVIDEITATISAYLTVIQAKGAVANDKESLERSKKTVEDDRVRIKAGKMAKADIVQDLAQVANQKVILQNDQNVLAQDKLKLLNAIGLDPKFEFDLPNDVNIKEMYKLPKLNRSIYSALHNNTSFQSDTIGLAKTKRTLLTSKNSALWQVNLTATKTVGGGTGGGSNANFASLTNSKNSSESIELNVSIPIDDVSLKQAIINAKVALQQAEIALAEEKRDLRSQVITSVHQIHSDYKQVELAEQSVELAKRSVEIADVKHSHGRVSNFELLTLQKQLQGRGREFINSKIAYLIEQSSLDQLLGTTLETWHLKLIY